MGVDGGGLRHAVENVEAGGVLSWGSSEEGAARSGDRREVRDGRKAAPEPPDL